MKGAMTKKMQLRDTKWLNYNIKEANRFQIMLCKGIYHTRLYWLDSVSFPKVLTKSVDPNPTAPYN